MLSRNSLTGMNLLLVLFGLSTLMAGCSFPIPSATSAPAGQPTLLYFYTDA